MKVVNITLKWEKVALKLQQINESITDVRQRLGDATELHEVQDLEQQLEHLHNSEFYYSRKLGTLNL